MNFEKYLEIKGLIKSEIDIIEKNIISSISVSEPLNKSIVEFLTAPSKRIRIVLGILYMKAQNKNISTNHLELFSAVELIHSASLIHDDIIDESKIRRGKSTLSFQFGNKLGVISGDYLLSLAMKKISALKNTAVLEKFSHTLECMTKGEINQYFEKYKIGTLDSYIEKSKNKTAYLFENVISCSELLSGNSFSDSLNDFGLNFGIAFQIRDDLENVLNKDTLKPSNNDIEQGIYTAPVIFSGGIDDLSLGIEKTCDLVNNYVDKAKNQILRFENNKYTMALNQLLELFKYE